MGGRSIGRLPVPLYAPGTPGDADPPGFQLGGIRVEEEGGDFDLLCSLWLSDSRLAGRIGVGGMRGSPRSDRSKSLGRQSLMGLEGSVWPPIDGIHRSSVLAGEGVGGGMLGGKGGRSKFPYLEL